MAITYHPAGDGLFARGQIVVCTVNCVGVMGKGVALACKARSPELYAKYSRICQRREMKPGKVFGVRAFDTQSLEERLFYLAATKDHWQNPSRIEWVKNCLIQINEMAKTEELPIALPPLGCGNGGLHWGAVKPLYEELLRDHDYRVYK